MEDKNAIVRDGSAFDYKMSPETEDRVWIRVRTAEVGILQNHEGISIDVWPPGGVSDGPFASIWLMWSDFEGGSDDD
jgi:hypothetical protein